ncbi:hypothetical protein BDY21DRAFT_332501 [Lineolata rhizophorae]|uniref:C2H2-type domain-containing protein n=1 Tax=Lineolata rhizophorae TaxID=578093 RepID=A0A6A6PC41_9PEZI|nr:hypothetical protein BDY21DRAFT_332501 [Lineolata rhizophorae]
MTSFESYSTMAPQLASDFSLYASTQEEQFPDFVATTQPGLMANPAFFDPSPYGPALSLDAHASMNAFHGMQTHPHGFPSPANSASHSFDVAPPHLSTASESGASVQSTSSSAMGSPSLNAQYQQQESWTNLDNGLGLAPGFNTSGLGYDPIVAPNDKLTVGESTVISSSPQSGVPVSPFHSFFPSKSDLNPIPEAQEPPQTPVSQKSPEMKRRPSVKSPEFKSPIAPASAFARGSTVSVSPPPKQLREGRRPSLGSAEKHWPRRNSTLSNQVWPQAQKSQSSSPTFVASPSQSQSPFFSQSNGLFMPPLDSFCSSPCSNFPVASHLLPHSRRPRTATNRSFASDPNLIHPFGSPNAFTTGSPYPDFPAPSPMPFVEHPPSPTPSQGSPHHRGSNQFKAGSTSPYLHNRGFHPYPQPGFNGSRRPSASSIHSIHSKSSRRSGSFELDDETREKGLCPIPDCGRVFKDLKAHMLTHQNERPEKCPIITCEYHQKGFARKYDKNRHTLTHYKGNMVCGFCPGSGSAAEKSFNRADVFKRHLTSVHGVEQTPPNSRKKSPQTAKKGTYAAGAAQPSHSTGTCSTCGVTFASAQDFYEHLDDCVLRVVQQTEPSEAINQKLLASVAADDNVKETMEMHCLPSAVDGGFGSAAPAAYDEEDEDDADADADADADDADDDVNAAAAAPSARAARSGKGAIRSRRDASC